MDGRAPRDLALGGCGDPPVNGPRADRYLSHDRPAASQSRLLDTGLVGPEHVEIAARVRKAAAADVQDLKPRARKIQRFFAQPFYVAEAYTRRRGVTVGVAEALQTCRDILDGLHDRLPEEAFYFTGGMDQILAKADEQTGSTP